PIYFAHGCPLTVISGHGLIEAPCPLYLRKLPSMTFTKIAAFGARERSGGSIEKTWFMLS
ncbi:MAG: hypothetical protein WB774_11225, partial [Xanthobacteraceae bacterium]